MPSFTNWTKYTNGLASTVTNYATTENVNNAVSWLKAQKKSAPFFLWLAFNAPHEPLHLPPAGLHKFTSLNGTPANINAQPKAYFKAMIQAMDHEIGRLFDTLRSMNRFDSTDIIFIGDNGNTARTAQISDLSKAKGTVYDYGVNVPLIFAGPSVVKPGRVSQALVNTADLFATMVENFGYSNWRSRIPSNKPVDAVSLMPILKNTTDSIRPWTFSEIFKLTTDSSDGKAIRSKNYKLIKFDYGAEEFYNIASDPLESNNLLKGSLSQTELTNYQYLCNEMNQLLGSNKYCNNSVGLHEKNQYNSSVFEIFPSPTHGIVSVKFSTQRTLPTKIMVMDMSGKVFYRNEKPEIRQTLNIHCPDWKSGLYFVIVVQDNLVFTKKIVLE